MSRRQWLMTALERILPLVGALLLIGATWVPWVTFRVVLAPGGPANHPFVSDFSITGSNGLLMMLTQARPSLAYSTLRWLALLWSIAPLFGLLLGLFHLRVPRPSRILTALYGIWLVLISVICVPIIVGLLTTLGPLSCWQTCTVIPVTSRRPELGLWLAIAGLAPGWIAFARMLLWRRSGRSAGTPLRSRTAIRYSPHHRRGAIAMTLGAAIWALGLFAVPWATAGCTGLHLSLNHFVRGACSGVDGWDVFSTGTGPNASMSLLFLEVAPVTGLYVVIDVWLPRLMRSTWVVALGWCLVTTALYIIGAVGVRATLAHPPVFTAEGADMWEPSYGVTICAAGILLAWMGAVLLARAEMAQARKTV